MIPKSQNTIRLSLSISKAYMLYRIKGELSLPARFDLINLDGIKVRSVDVCYGNEFVLPIEDLVGGEYLFAISSGNQLLHTGVVTITL
jgi:hypothetical protein